ncbi:NUDIX domain-containing protein, partial [Streptomyces sp. NPDC050204]|uniref:NUDIX domain-containing protein n=1 Tax=Streptomyces sp. NPDC050204 TaxID=3155514 RepID=UPI0034488705
MTEPKPIRTADSVITTRDRRVLLIERKWDPFEGHWALPGGYAKCSWMSHLAPAETSSELGVSYVHGDPDVS